MFSVTFQLNHHDAIQIGTDQIHSAFIYIHTHKIHYHRHTIYPLVDLTVYLNKEYFFLNLKEISNNNIMQSECPIEPVIPLIGVPLT